MNDHPISIAGLLEMTPGTRDNPCWINQPVSPCQVQEATQRQPKSGKGMPFYTGTLIDPDTGASIGFTAFGRKFFPREGAVIEISGQGNSLTEYNQEYQITIGQKAVVGTIAGAPERQQAPQRQHRAAAPAARQQAPAQRSSAQAQGNVPVQGQTVGMALNNAGLDMRALMEAGGLDFDVTSHEAVSRFLWQRASAYIRVSRSLELGKLSMAGTPGSEAPSGDQDGDEQGQGAVQEEPQPEPPPPPRRTARPRPQPGPDGSVAHNADEEDVPF